MVDRGGGVAVLRCGTDGWRVGKSLGGGGASPPSCVGWASRAPVHEEWGVRPELLTARRPRGVPVPGRQSLVPLLGHRATPAPQVLAGRAEFWWRAREGSLGRGQHLRVPGC